MTAILEAFPPLFAPGDDKALALALRLADTENALLALTSGQVDAIVDRSGRTYLLRPAQQHLQESERRLQTLIESAADVITVVNRGGVILSQSNAVIQMLGFQPEQLMGRNFFELIHEDDLTTIHGAFFNVIEGLDEIATAQFRHRTRDGSYRLLEATVSKLRDVSVPSVVLTCRDVSQRQHAGGEAAARREAALSDESYAKDRFLAMLAHELRTPLTPALLGVQALEGDERFAEARPTLLLIRRNIELQARVIDNLLDFSRITHGKLQTKRGSIDIHAAVGNVLAICESEIAARQIVVRVGPPATDSHVRADATDVQQIVWNLVRNAVKFSEPGGSIEITFANASSGQHTLAIIDHGIGIEPSLLPRVFESFQQGDRSAQQRYGGLGLGLFIAKTLTQAQQGTLAVASEGSGEGATFLLTLESAEAIDDPPAAKVAPESLEHVRILLVEDHADTRTVFARLLERGGHIVFSAPDTASALQLADTHSFDLVISDLGLPDGTGYDLMKRLMFKQPSLQGIALSGHGLPSDIAQSREAGFTQHLVKPVTLERLGSSIQTAAAEIRAGLAANA